MKKYEENVLNVVYATDEKYAGLTGISIYSLLDKNRDFLEIHIYIIDDGIDIEAKRKICDVVKQFGRQLIFCPSLKLEKKINMPDTLEKNLTIYNNLFLGSLLGVERVLYLDSDIVIINSLKELWNTDISDYLLAAVQDISGIIERYEAKLKTEDVYFNSGVMLFNLKKCKEYNIEKQFVAAIQNGSSKSIFRSQRIVNQVCKNNILRISPKYNLLNEYIEFNADDLKIFVQSKNFYSQEEMKAANDNPVIIHFAGYERPWCYKKCYHKYTNVFHEIEKRTPWGKIQMLPTTRKNLIMDRRLHHLLPHKLYMCIKYLNRKRKTNKFYKNLLVQGEIQDEV